MKGTRTRINTKRIYGDDTGHLHIGPGQTVEITEVSVYYRKFLEFSDARKHCCNLPKIQTKI